MKNTFKKLSAVLLVLVMVLAMSANAFAAEGQNPDMTGENGVIGEFTTPDVATPQGTSVKIYKEITAYNPEECEVYAPAITFNYTIAAGDAGKDIYDANSHHHPASNVHAQTKAGVGSPTITDKIELVPGTNKLNASVNGTANRFPLTINFAEVNFLTQGSGAGVYRYVISETTTEAAKNAANIKEGSGANTLYLDVYVNGNGEIYGYVLFTNNDDPIDASANDDVAAATAAGKTEGFVGSQPNNGKYGSEDASVADKYYTFNLAITKKVENDDYIKNTHHEFPFTVTLDNPTVTANVLPIMTVGENATQTALSAGAIGTGENATVWTPTIADSATITYVGIPTGTTVTIKETNNVTGVTYSSVSTNADTNAAVKNIYTNDTSNNAIVNCGATALAKATDNHTVTFTNTLLQISPTGIVMRVAPYVLILAAGVALLVLSRRRREEEV